MILNLIYDNDSGYLYYSLKDLCTKKSIDFNAFNMSIYKDRKKGFKIKGGFSARLNPFAVIYNEDNEPVKAFYTEAGKCSLDEITKTLNTIL